MGRALALDVGTKRTGVAETDPNQMIATGLTTIPTKDLIPFLREQHNNPGFSDLIVGEPKRLHGEKDEIAHFIENLLRSLASVFKNVSIHRVDERFTSKMASRVIAQSSLKKSVRENKMLIDEVSATIILQDWLYTRKA